MREPSGVRLPDEIDLDGLERMSAARLASTLAPLLLLVACYDPVPGYAYEPAESQTEEPQLPEPGAIIDTRAVAVINSPDNIGCAAFAVAPRLLVTAAHCLRRRSVSGLVPIPEDAPVVESVEYTFQHTDQSREARVSTLIRAVDFAALELEEDAPAFLPTREPILGEFVVVPRAVNVGILTGEVVSVDDAGVILVSVTTEEGDSGSPAIGADGAAFGIMSSSAEVAEAYAAPVLHETQ